MQYSYVNGQHTHPIAVLIVAFAVQQLCATDFVGT